MKKKVFMCFLLVVNFLSLGLKSVFATEVSEAESTDNITVTPFAMKPTTIYIGFQNIYFIGNSAPATMYYQTSRYGVIYRGYLTRDYSYPIIWRTKKTTQVIMVLFIEMTYLYQCQQVL